MAWIQNRPVGLVHLDAERSCPGYTLFCPVRGTTANLLDAEGRIVWRWRHPEGIQHAKLAPNGNLLIQTQPAKSADGAENIGGSAETLMELDWDSNVVWEYRDPFQHHDYQRLENGNHLVLSWKRVPESVHERVQGGYVDPADPTPMWGDVVHEVAPSGEVVREWRSWEHLSFEKDVRCPLESRKEWTHANSIDVLPDGRWLLSLRLVSTIVIVEPETGEIVWRWGPGELSHQHAATTLDDGRILAFDNGCHRRGLPSFSRVVEVDLESRKIVWSYHATTVLAFYSFMVSGADRLENGNTLITEGATGRLFEVTPDHQVVWEYVSPFMVIDPRFGPTPAVFRAHRYPAERFAGRDLTPGRFQELEDRIEPGGLSVGDEG
ncbi:MAG: aryl-sulfate sulfotransferase [Myxococcota bacterium]